MRRLTCAAAGVQPPACSTGLLHPTLCQSAPTAAAPANHMERQLNSPSVCSRALRYWRLEDRMMRRSPSLYCSRMALLQRRRKIGSRFRVSVEKQKMLPRSAGGSCFECMCRRSDPGAAHRPKRGPHAPSVPRRWATHNSTTPLPCAGRAQAMGCSRVLAAVRAELGRDVSRALEQRPLQPPLKHRALAACMWTAGRTELHGWQPKHCGTQLPKATVSSGIRLLADWTVRTAQPPTGQHPFPLTLRTGPACPGSFGPA